MTEKAAGSIAAVVFVKISREGVISPCNEKPYFYLNMIGVPEGGLALVSTNGEKSSQQWGVVRVERLIDVTDAKALARVTNQLASTVSIDAETYRESRSRLGQFIRATEASRIQSKIDQELGNPVPEGPTQVEYTSMPEGGAAIGYRKKRSYGDADQDIPF